MTAPTLASILLLASGPAGVPEALLKVPRPPAVRAPTEAEIRTALRRGAEFLLGYQNRDGSWGSARRTKQLNIYAPVPGAHQGFRAAVTALCISALIELDSPDPNVTAALDRAEAWLLDFLPRVRRPAPRAVYNNWAHAYAIRALVRMARRTKGDPARAAKIRTRVAEQVQRLRQYSCLGGGWGYYDFRYRFQHPVGMATSFTTASCLIALREARDFGAAVPAELVEAGLRALRLQQRPDFGYVYSAGFHFYPGRLICRPGGSLARSQACNLALRLWGDARITDEVLKAWLDRLYARNGWLSRARKMPVPHESWFSVSGYFYYYGHFYAGACIEQLPRAERPHFQKHLARILLDLQETDGSWWDYPMYDYHQGWGTAYAMMALLRCLPEGPAGPAGGR